VCKFTRKISNVENLHDLNVFFYTSSKKSTFKAGNKAQIHTIFFNRVDFLWYKKKTNVVKHEIPKWRPNSRWASECFYRLKLVYLIQILKNSKWPKNSIWQIFCNKVQVIW
jgi:hypothetical protein